MMNTLSLRLRLLALLLVVLARADEYSPSIPRLGDYSIHFQKCNFIKSYDDELAADDANTVVLGTQRFVAFRLCPNNNNSTTDDGTSCDQCETDYGEYMVDLETYLISTVQHYQQQQAAMCYTCEVYCVDNSNNQDDEEQEKEEGDDSVRRLVSVACESCHDECAKIENMEQNGYVDASEFLECQMIYDPEDDGAAALYAGPICASDGSKIKIAVFTDERCEFLDETKEVDDYLMDANGYAMKLSHALLKQTYAQDSCIGCKPAANNDDEIGAAEVCQELYASAAKCETPNGMTDGMHSSPRYYNQMAQEHTVCRFIETVRKGTYGDMDFLLPPPEEPPSPEQQQQATAQARKGPNHHRRLEQLEDPYYDTDNIPPAWMSNYALHFERCLEFPQWNREAYDDESVRLATKRLAHYRLCPKEDTSTNTCPSTDSTSGGCNDYTVDLNEFMRHYFSAIRWDCDYLEEKVCRFCQDDVACLSNCYDLHGMAGACSYNNVPVEPLADDDGSPSPLVPSDFLECRRLSRSVDGSVIYIGPYCAAEYSAQEVRLALFSDDTCTVLKRQGYLPHGLIYSDQSLIHHQEEEGTTTCLSCEQKSTDDYGGTSLSSSSRGVCESLYPFSGKCEEEGTESANACYYIQSFMAANQNLYVATPPGEQVFSPTNEGEEASETTSIESADPAEDPDSLSSGGTSTQRLSSMMIGLLGLSLLLAC